MRATEDFLAALVGGTSARASCRSARSPGLLWIAVLTKLDVEVPLRRFAAIGVAVTVPSLAVSLGTLDASALPPLEVAGRLLLALELVVSPAGLPVERARLGRGVVLERGFGQ